MKETCTKYYFSLNTQSWNHLCTKDVCFEIKTSRVKSCNVRSLAAGPETASRFLYGCMRRMGSWSMCSEHFVYRTSYWLFKTSHFDKVTLKSMTRHALFLFMEKFSVLHYLVRMFWDTRTQTHTHTHTHTQSQKRLATSDAGFGCGISMPKKFANMFANCWAILRRRSQAFPKFPNLASVRSRALIIHDYDIWVYFEWKTNLCFLLMRYRQTRLVIQQQGLAFAGCRQSRDRVGLCCTRSCACVHCSPLAPSELAMWGLVVFIADVLHQICLLSLQRVWKAACSLRLPLRSGVSNAQVPWKRRKSILSLPVLDEYRSMNTSLPQSIWILMHENRGYKLWQPYQIRLFCMFQCFQFCRGCTS